MSIKVGPAGPPHRDGTVAEFRTYGESTVSIVAEMFVDRDKLMIGFYSREGGPSWDFELADFLEAIGQGMATLHR
jgi:hypothetical protein